LDGERSKTGVLVAVICWLVIGAAIAFAAKKWIVPMFKQREFRTIAQQTGSTGKYKQEVRLAADAFSGYAILRSDEMANCLKARGIKLTLVDDKADYLDRARKLESGALQMAVFTLDSLLKVGSELGAFPASIVYVIDETRGADAMVAYTNIVRNLSDLNRADARIVCTPDSPSEFLARIVVGNFSLPQLPSKWMTASDGAGDAFKQLRTVPPGERRAYVLWEPYVSMACDLPGVGVLVDSSKLKGFIVDVLVCQRDFLLKNEATVRTVVESYARAAFVYNSNRNKLIELIVEDAKTTGGERLDRSMAERLVQGILWKNTVENYAHFGVMGVQESQGLEHLEDSLTKISGILVRTGALKEDPLNGQPNALFYDRILKQMKSEGFHPARELNLLTDLGSGGGTGELIRAEQELESLTEDQWRALVPVGELSVQAISFGRGAASINLQGERELANLGKTMQSMPRYYLLAVGQARPEGDVEANRQLAQSRADAAVRVLADHGVSRNRIKTTARVAAEGTGEAQSVTFVVCQKPY
jgi:outer membrane protein OmpA-like peptidoglycan-associated protein